jgi:Tfp pilus assembly protein PilO
VTFFQKKQQVLICVVAVMLVADFLLFGCLPLLRTMKAIRKTESALAQAIDKGTQGSKQLPALSDQLQKLQQATLSFEVHIPAQRDLGTFLQQLADLMTEHNLKGQVVAPQNEIKADELCCIPINMQGKGRLPQIFEFYKQLQTMDRLVRVEQVKLINDSSYSGEISMETRVVIYYRPEVEMGKEILDKSEKI